MKPCVGLCQNASNLREWKKVMHQGQNKSEGNLRAILKACFARGSKRTKSDLRENGDENIILLHLRLCVNGHI